MATGLDEAAVELSERQQLVLRAVVAGFIGEAAPIGSRTLSHRLPVPLSSASIRAVLAELMELGLVEQPHRSAGRVPSERGLRYFVDHLLLPTDLVASQRRDLELRIDESRDQPWEERTSGLLSEYSRQLGFVVAPRIERLVLRHLSFVRLSAERLLVVLVAHTGTAYRFVVDDEHSLDQAALDRASALLNERIAGRTLPEVRERIAEEARLLERRANRLWQAALAIGRRALDAAEGSGCDLVIETRRTLLGQPEFHDPRRIERLFEALETKRDLLRVLDRVLEQGRVRVALGSEIDDPSLRECALIATPYGRSEAGGTPLGVLGVIGPLRMDFARIIPLVEYLSTLVTGKLCA